MKLIHAVFILFMLAAAACSSDSSPAGSETAPASQAREISVIARQWEFEPSQITVKEGERVILHVESVDVEHGFAIPEFGINENLAPGKSVDIEFTADMAGSYSFFCSVYCGSGHTSMRGTLIVES